MLARALLGTSQTEEGLINVNNYNKKKLKKNQNKTHQNNQRNREFRNRKDLLYKTNLHWPAAEILPIISWSTWICCIPNTSKAVGSNR